MAFGTKNSITVWKHSIIIIKKIGFSTCGLRGIKFNKKLVFYLDLVNVEKIFRGQNYWRI